MRWHRYLGFKWKVSRQTAQAKKAEGAKCLTHGGKPKKAKVKWQNGSRFNTHLRLSFDAIIRHPHH
jgi:hypothetical protein